ncbi:DUF6371 domain-containing protein [Telluribacter sp.]|jgi:hypothetical protein|uniref:DUF6371 domain-containing protein n=1 Tax=Telluribacter sp. TaxID=1978767 RepID=UPI002E14F237|nr:DUF6371 domain-containing protein [Telluribacter sp.]
MPTDYRFQLKPYKTPSDRGTCPNSHCGAKRSFSPYIDTQTGETLPEQYGRCNRADQCGYHLNPYKDGYARMIYTKERGENISWKPKSITYTKPQPKPKVDIPVEVFKDSLTGFEQNQFISYLLTLYPDEVVKQLIEAYYIGSAGRWEGDTLFWFISQQGRIRAGQVKQFDSSGHTRKYTGREGERKSCTTWIHSVLRYRCQQKGDALPDWLNAYIEQPGRVDCLFGEHLLNRYPDRPVALFEAPKTAVMATPFFEQYVCLATGSLSYLTQERLQALRGRNVVLYPDLSADGGAFAAWTAKAQQYAEIARFRVSTLLEEDHTITDKQRESGYDMADYIADRIGQTQAAVCLPQPAEEEPEPLPPGVHTLTNWLGARYQIEINQNGYPTLFDEK